MKIAHSFPVHFALGASLILAANASFLIINHNIPDGRLFLELPITSVIILLWMAAIGFMSRRFFANGGISFMTAYTVIVSTVFALFAGTVQYLFQDVHFMPVSMMMAWPILGIFSYSIYIVILGVSLALYPLIATLVQSILSKYVPVASEQMSRS